MSTDVSVVVLAHREGRLLHAALRSVYRAVDHAVQQGLTAEVRVVADDPDARTAAYLQSVDRPGVTVHRVRLGDTALTRNHGAQLAIGTSVCFLDACHLCGENWLSAAVKYLTAAAGDTIVHPEYQITFGAASTIRRHLASTDPEIDIAGQFETSHWSSVAVAKRSLFVRFPYSPCTTDTGFGFPEWHFDCETLAAGIEHAVVPGTVVFRRLMPQAPAPRLDESLPLMRPSRLFDPEIMAASFRPDARR